VGRLLFLAVPGTIAANLFATLLLTKASIGNYPGGDALTAFHEIYSINSPAPPHVHISNLAAQTGASLFLQLNAPPQYQIHERTTSWIYNKTEKLSTASLSSSTSPFTHLISEISPDEDFTLEKSWRTVKVIQGFDRWTLDKDLLKPARYLSGNLNLDLLKRFVGILKMAKSEKLWILERKD